MMPDKISVKKQDTSEYAAMSMEAMSSAGQAKAEELDPAIAGLNASLARSGVGAASEGGLDPAIAGLNASLARMGANATNEGLLQNTDSGPQRVPAQHDPILEGRIAAPWRTRKFGFAVQDNLRAALREAEKYGIEEEDVATHKDATFWDAVDFATGLAQRPLFSAIKSINEGQPVLTAANNALRALIRQDKIYFNNVTETMPEWQLKAVRGIGVPAWWVGQLFKTDKKEKGEAYTDTEMAALENPMIGKSDVRGPRTEAEKLRAGEFTANMFLDPMMIMSFTKLPGKFIGQAQAAAKKLKFIEDELSKAKHWKDVWNSSDKATRAMIRLDPSLSETYHMYINPRKIPSLNLEKAAAIKARDAARLKFFATDPFGSTIIEGLKLADQAMMATKFGRRFAYATFRRGTGVRQIDLSQGLGIEHGIATQAEIGEDTKRLYDTVLLNLTPDEKQLFFTIGEEPAGHSAIRAFSEEMATIEQSTGGLTVKAEMSEQATRKYVEQGIRDRLKRDIAKLETGQTVTNPVTGEEKVFNLAGDIPQPGDALPRPDITTPTPAYNFEEILDDAITGLRPGSEGQFGVHQRLLDNLNLAEPATPDLRFGNPNAVKRLIKLQAEDPASATRVFNALNEVDQYMSKTTDLRTISNIMHPDMLERPYRNMVETVRDFRNAVSHASNVIGERATGIRKVNATRVATADRTFAELVSRRYTEEAARTFVQRTVLDDTMRSAAELTSKHQWYEQYIEKGLAGLLETPGSELFQLRSRMTELAASMARTPQWVHRILTPDAIKQLDKLESLNWPRWRAINDAFHSTSTQSVIERQFADLNTGRPWSLEEFEAHLLQGDIAIGKKGPHIKSIPQMFDQEPLTYVESHTSWPRRIIERISGKTSDPKMVSFYDLNPAKIAALEGVQTARAVGTAKFLQDTAQWGISKKVYNLLPDSKKALYTTLDKLPGGREILGVEGELLGGRMPGLREVYFQKDIGDALVRGSRPFVHDNHVLIKSANKLMEYFYRTNLSIWPAFHSRNVWGMLSMANQYGWMAEPKHAPSDFASMCKSGFINQSLRNSNTARADMVSIHFKNAGIHVPGHEAHRIAERFGISRGGAFSEVFSDIRKAEMSGEPWSVWDKLNPIGPEFPPTKFMSAVGHHSEAVIREGFFYSLLERGVPIEEASALVKKYMGNFANEVLTPFEKAIAGPVLPFYRWLRFNVPLQVEQMLTNLPSRMRLAATQRMFDYRIRTIFGDQYSTTQPLPGTPEWLINASAIPLWFDERTKRTKFYSPVGWMPQADMAMLLGARKFVKSMAAQTAPAIIKPFEYGYGISVFMGPEAPLDYKDSVLFGQVLPANIANLMLTSTRGVGELQRWDPSGKWNFGPLATEDWRNDIRNYQQKPSFYRYLRLMLGFTTYDVNLYEQQVRERAEMADRARSKVELRKSRGFPTEAQKEALEGGGSGGVPPWQKPIELKQEEVKMSERDYHDDYWDRYSEESVRAANKWEQDSLKTKTK